MHNKLQDLAVSDTGFVFDPHTGATFSTNAAGLVLIEGLKADAGRDELADMLRDRFEQVEADLLRDVDEFIVLLRKHGLLPSEFRISS